MRYYVRVTLLLAKLLNDRSPAQAPVPTRFSVKLLEHAQQRIRVYARHNHQFRRERDTMLLLEVSRLRAWSRLLRERETAEFQAAVQAFERAQAAPQAQVTLGLARTRYGEVLNKQYELLEACWQWILEAESLLISLGFQSAHVRRMLLERIKTAIATLHLAMAYRRNPLLVAPGHFALRMDAALPIADSTIAALRQASRGHRFWEKIVEGQEAKLARTRAMLAQMDAPAASGQAGGQQQG
jgi:predicted transcriptional regulator